MFLLLLSSLIRLDARLVRAGVRGGREDSVSKESIVKQPILLPQLPLMLIVSIQIKDLVLHLL